MTTPCTPEINSTHEVRFAVVMYGGVSLAIYINGVAQELLSLVRSTASAYEENGKRVALSGVGITGSDDPDKEKKLRGTERVYRKLSYLLSDDALLHTYRASLATNASSVCQSPDMLDDYIAPAPPDSKLDPITTRFIVDILSGTSAGGINAIFLAKALTNDQSIDRLKKLWVEEGDIGLLINDKKSLAGLHLRNQEPPKSLLNSRRMYLKLLKAFDEMDTARASKVGYESPYVNELDLFVTTTDIKGVTLPLQLSDKVVYEKRHRNVFHFKYGTRESFGEYSNQFLRCYNPFLAFSARCTSSFPFAFEPMRLCELDCLLEAYGDSEHISGGGSKSDLWKPFFAENIDPRAENNKNKGTVAGNIKIDVEKRSFGDGGYLDNKPFSYATESLSHRQSIVPVDRKLIYIEPSPEHPEDYRDSDGPPDALLNAKAALLDLPTYETIREDLQRVLQRNRTIRRVARIIEDTKNDLDKLEQRGGPKKSEEDRYKFNSGQWRIMDMAMMVKYCGIYFLPYRRLRIASVTDDLTSLVARINNLDENSASFIAVRALVRAWRQTRYVEYYNPQNTDLVKNVLEGKIQLEDNPPTEDSYNAFLDDFDFSYRFRRLNFLLSKIDSLTRLAFQLPRKQGDLIPSEQSVSEKQPEILGILKKLNYFDAEQVTNDERIKLRQEVLSILAYLKCELIEVHTALRVAVRKLQSKPQSESSDKKKVETLSKGPSLLPIVELEIAIEGFHEAVQGLNLDGNQLSFLLGMPARLTKTGDVISESNSIKEFATLDDVKSVQRAEELLNANGSLKGRLQSAAEKLRIILSEKIIGPTSNHSKLLLSPDNRLPAALNENCDQLADFTKIDPKTIHSVRGYLREFYIHFDDSDQILFPILYQTDFGESAEVGVFRISPEDAPNLIDEMGSGADGRRKLAGNAFFHFGAFLDRVWRENDIMWGRLDGAERLITALLPDPWNEAVRNKLISEAHGAILLEEMPPKTQVELSGLLAAALIRASSGETFEVAISKVVGALKDPKIKSRLATAMRACLENEKLLSFVKEHYEVNRQLEPKPLLRYTARATQVIGKIFDDVAKTHKVENKAGLWIARVGQIFWGLVEVSVPGSVASLLMFHWLKLLFVLEILLIAGSLLLGNKEVKNFALTAFGVTVVVSLAVVLLGDYMRGRKRWLRSLVISVIGLVLLLAVVGVADLLGLGLSSRIQGWLKPLDQWFQAAPEWLKPVRDWLARIF